MSWKNTTLYYEATIVAAHNAEIGAAAHRLAYYTAMLDATADDPMDDPFDQAEAVEWYKEEIKEALQEYQALVNATFFEEEK